MDSERSPPSCSPPCSPLHSAVNPMEYMQSVFSMCDSDGDGIISVEDLKSIGLQIGWDGVSECVCMSVCVCACVRTCMCAWVRTCVLYACVRMCSEYI